MPTTTNFTIAGAGLAALPANYYDGSFIYSGGAVPVRFFGTQLVWKAVNFFSAGKFNVVVAADGGDTVTVAGTSTTVTNGQSGDFTLATGLSDAWHIAYIFMEALCQPGTFDVTSDTTPLCNNPFSVGVTGKTANLAYFNDFGSCSRTGGTLDFLGTGAVKFSVNITNGSGKIFVYGYTATGVNRYCGASVDGGFISPWQTGTTTGTRQNDVILIASGLANGDHDVVLYGMRGGSQVTPTVTVIGGTMNTTTLATPERWGFYRDSRINNFDTDLTYPNAHEILANYYGAIPFAYGVAGSSAKDFPAGTAGCNQGGQLQARVDGLATNLDKLFVDLSTNAIDGLCGSVTTTAFEAAYLDMLQKIRIRCPSTRIVNIEPTTPNNDETNLRAFDAKIISAMATAADGNTIHIVMNPTPSGTLYSDSYLTGHIHELNNGSLLYADTIKARLDALATPPAKSRRRPGSSRIGTRTAIYN